MNTTNMKTATKLINAILVITILSGCANLAPNASSGVAPATEIRDASRHRCAGRPAAHRKGCGRVTG